MPGTVEADARPVETEVRRHVELDLRSLGRARGQAHSTEQRQRGQTVRVRASRACPCSRDAPASSRATVGADLHGIARPGGTMASDQNSTRISGFFWKSIDLCFILGPDRRGKLGRDSRFCHEVALGCGGAGLHVPQGAGRGLSRRKPDYHVRCRAGRQMAERQGPAANLRRLSGLGQAVRPRSSARMDDGLFGRGAGWRCGEAAWRAAANCCWRMPGTSRTAHAGSRHLGNPTAAPASSRAPMRATPTRSRPISRAG